MIDSHIHLDKLSEIEIKKAVEKGVIMWSVATDYCSAIKNLELKKKYPKNIKVFLGIHPEEPKKFSDLENVLKVLKVRLNEIDGVGEIGIPAFYLNRFNSQKMEEMMDILKIFIKNAAEMNLPIVLHIVGKDIYKVLALLDKYKIKKAMFHWYVGDEKEITEIVKRGYFISVNIECKENHEYRKYVKKIPLENIFIETDAPYGYTRETSGTEIIGMYEELSKLLNISVNFIKEKIENNCTKFFD